MVRMAPSHGNNGNRIKVDRNSDLTDVLRWLLQLGNSLNKYFGKGFCRTIAVKTFVCSCVVSFVCL
jgi:hypothetical protein